MAHLKVMKTKICLKKDGKNEGGQEAEEIQSCL